MHKGPKPAELQLSEQERNAWAAMVRRHRTAQQLAKRGRMILEAAEGKSHAQIGRELGVSVDTVRKWRLHGMGLQAIALKDRSVAERLADLPRPGRPSQITAEPSCQLMALACEPPKERPLSHWTGREIAEEVMARGILEHLSPRPAARLLNTGISSPT